MRGQAKKVIRTDKDGNEVTFESAFKAAESVAGEQGHVSRACRNGWEYRGYSWRYEEASDD